MSNERLLFGISLCTSNLFSCLTLATNCTFILKSANLIFLSFPPLSQMSDQHSSLKASPAYLCSLSFIGISPNTSLSFLTPSWHLHLKDPTNTASRKVGFRRIKPAISSSMPINYHQPPLSSVKH